jgi:lysozyme
MQLLMKYSKPGLQLTEGFEGCKLVAYIPMKGDVPTIGYGHTRGVYLGMTCTQEQAEQWLLEDLKLAEDNVNLHVRVKLTQGQFDALVDFAFNCGCANLDGSTLLKLVNTGDFEHAAKEFEKWDHASGKVVAGLLRRRQAEEAEFLNS